MEKGECMDYIVNINQFEGPMDLLLHLIKKNNIQIYDIQIEELTKQYLDYITKMEELNLDVASEYLVMAAELMEMKSRYLLPKVETEEEEEDPKEDLIERLIEYSKYKEVTKSFQLLESQRKQIHTKEPSNCLEFRKEDVLEENLGLEDLLEAFSKFLKRKEKERPLHTTVTKKEYSVEERNKQIRDILKKKKKVSFDELFDVYNKEYYIVTFLSILDLAKKEELRIEQEKNFQQIIIEARS